MTHKEKPETKIECRNGKKITYELRERINPARNNRYSFKSGVVKYWRKVKEEDLPV